MNTDLSFLDELPQLLHPAFDIAPNAELMSLCFQMKSPDGGQPGTIHILSDGRIVHITLEPSPSFQGRKVHYRERMGGLTRVDDQWLRGDLKRFGSGTTCMGNSELHSRLQEVWIRHIDFDDLGKYIIAESWALMTYVFPLFASVPFLHALGPKNTGKSQFLDTMQQLVRCGYKSRRYSATPVNGALRSANTRVECTISGFRSSA